MGLMCQIYLQKPPDGNYRPGSVVCGTIKYAIDKETTYKDITVSLKGKGKCHWSESRSDGKTDDRYHGTEDLVLIHTRLLNTKTEVTVLAPGVYTHPFHFIFPPNIPSSYKDYHCTITYNVVLKFERPGLFNFDKTFRTELPVVSHLVNPLPEAPIIYGLQKSLFQLFSSKKSVINLKAKITESFIAAGELAHLDLEVENDSNIKIPHIKTELYEKITYTANCGRKKTKHRKIVDCKNETGSIEPAKIKELTTIVPTALDLRTIQHSKVISRDYKLNITVKLPMPHFDATLDIPLLIGDKEPVVELAEEVTEDALPDDPPPSYWEVMAEDECTK